MVDDLTDDAVSTDSEHALRCDYCNGPLVAMFNEDSKVAWAECTKADHSFVQNIFTPVFIDGRETGYLLHGELRVGAA